MKLIVRYTVEGAKYTQLTCCLLSYSHAVMITWAQLNYPEMISESARQLCK